MPEPLVGVFSDTHIGKRPLAAREYMQQIYHDSFRKAIDLFIEKGVDVVIHAGDIFEKRELTPHDVGFVKAEFQRLVDEVRAKHGKEPIVVLIRGNHDGSPETNALFYATHPLAKYIKVLGDPELAGRVEPYEDERVRIVGVSYHQHIRKKYAAIDAQVRAVFRDDSKLNILVVHNFIKGFHPQFGLPDISMLDGELLKDSGARYVISGHYHEKMGPSTVGDAIFYTPGATGPENLASEGPFYVSLMQGVDVTPIEVKPLYQIKAITVEAMGIQPLQWFIFNGLEQLRSAIKTNNDILVRVRFLGESNDDTASLVHRFMNEAEKIQQEHPNVKFVEAVNEVMDVVSKYISERVGSSGEWGKVVDFVGIDQPDAAKLVGEIEIALGSSASQRTGLLTDVDREVYIERWIKLLKRGEK